MLGDTVNKTGIALTVVASACTEESHYEVGTLRQLAGIMTDVRNVLEQEWQTTRQTHSKQAPVKSR